MSLKTKKKTLAPSFVSHLTNENGPLNHQNDARELHYLPGESVFFIVCKTFFVKEFYCKGPFC